MYGEASGGGVSGNGILFRFDPFTGKDTVLFNFSGSNGNTPTTALYLMPNKVMFGTCEFGGNANDGVLFSYNLNNGSENTIIDFRESNGANPAWTVIPYNGVLYGTTGHGGKYRGIGGSIFSYTPVSNKDSTIFNFNDTDGANIYGGLCMSNGKSFYGMAGQGGLYNDGVIYSFNPLTNKETVLFNFNGNIDGAYSQGTFIRDSNHLLYGLVTQGGSFGYGTLISFNPSTNKETTLITFNDTNGGYPFGDLLLATNELLYGMTASGGSKNDGVLCSYNVNTNKYTIVLNFDSTNGSEPGGDVIEDTVNKILYGMTMFGGKYNDGVIFSYNLNTGKDSVLFNFNGTNGANPYGTLLLVPYNLGDGVAQIKGESEEVNAYPNPAANYVTIESSISGVKYFYLYNELGELIEKATLTNDMTTLPLSQVAVGIYYYRVVDNEQNAIKTDKLLIIR